ncbi:MAG: imidazole glycerol phosphate synthase subunit HisH [Acidimicrobiales bacterium]
MSDIVIVPTGTANIASVVVAFTRLGVEPTESTDSRVIERAAGVIVPGVGAFGAAMDRVESVKLGPALTERINAGRPTLVVCVGMQLLCVASEETPGTAGLGIIDARLERFRGPERVPQLGWNHVEPPRAAKFLEPGWAYFANSYRLGRAPDGWIAATSDHGGEFVSALERDGVLACQFHPELSGPWGARILSRWLKTAEEAA